MLAKYSRALLKGVAVFQNDKWEAEFYIRVVHAVGLAPTHVELRVRRLKWLQQCLRRPGRSAQFLGTVFGALVDLETELTRASGGFA
eukprot:8761345-Pyramimonas_sp.AAC.1